MLFCLFGHILETDLIYLSDCSLFNLWVTCAIMVQITCAIADVVLKSIDQSREAN